MQLPQEFGGLSEESVNRGILLMKLCVYDEGHDVKGPGCSQTTPSKALKPEGEIMEGGSERTGLGVGEKPGLRLKRQEVEAQRPGLDPVFTAHRAEVTGNSAGCVCGRLQIWGQWVFIMCAMSLEV